MNGQSLFALLVGFTVVFGFAAGLSGAEKLDRGLIALEREDGSVFLSWRLLDEDSDDIAFQIRRRVAGSSGDAVVLTRGEPCRATNFIDETARRGKSYSYELYQSGVGRHPNDWARLGFC
ncbi:MAG: rhamnogalacturonan endolyase family protein [Planctomycetota bacterium]|jgi:hypothetical protein